MNDGEGAGVPLRHAHRGQIVEGDRDLPIRGIGYGGRSRGRPPRGQGGKTDARAKRQAEDRARGHSKGSRSGTVRASEGGFRCFVTCSNA